MDGWWDLVIKFADDCKDKELTDEDKDHIAKEIKEGFTGGEIIHGE